jgi:sugar phosphate isomerase/epimerase
MIQERLARLSVSELSTYRWSFEEDVLHYAEHGYHAVGVWRSKLHEYGEEKALELLLEHNVQVSSLQWAGGFTGLDGRSYRESILDGLEAVEWASQLGASCLLVLVGGRGMHTKPHAKRMALDALRELGEAAQAKRVSLAIEPMHVGCAGSWTWLTELPMTLDLVQEIGLPNVGLALDSYHLAHDPNLINWIPSIASMIKLVQLGDARSAPMLEQNRCLLGEGYLPLSQLMETIEQHGYQGFYEIEIVGEQVEHVSYEHLLSHSRQTCEGWFNEAVRNATHPK